MAYDSGQLGASSRLLACSRSLRQHSSVCCPFPADRHFCAAWLTRRGGVGVQLRGARQSVPGPMGDELLCWPLRSRSRSPLPASPVPERLKFSPISFVLALARTVLTATVPIGSHNHTYLCSVYKTIKPDNDPRSLLRARRPPTKL